MGAEDFLIDDGGDWEAVEDVAKGFPKLDVITTAAFIVEAINTVDACALVIAAQDKEVFRVADLEGKKEANSFDGLPSSIDVIA